MGMPTVKEAGAQWLTALYNKLCQEKIIITNGFKKVGIVEAVKQAILNTEDESTHDDVLASDHLDGPFQDC